MLRLWAISLKWEFRVVKSGSKEYEVKCVNAGCPWRVHAFKGKWKSNWKCSIVTEHTCLLSEVVPSHRNISCDFVAKQIYGLIMDNLNYEKKWLFDTFSRLTSTPLVIWRHDGLNKKCSRCGSAHTGHHMITYLVCYPRLLLEILEAFMTHTSYKPWLGGKAFCNEPSFA